jgi:hypothetical protein
MAALFTPTARAAIYSTAGHFRCTRRFGIDCARVDPETRALGGKALLGLGKSEVVPDEVYEIGRVLAIVNRKGTDHFSPSAEVVTLDQNYRSTQPILAAANAVIDLAFERFTKNLWTG